MNSIASKTIALLDPLCRNIEQAWAEKPTPTNYAGEFFFNPDGVADSDRPVAQAIASAWLGARGYTVSFGTYQSYATVIVYKGEPRP